MRDVKWIAVIVALMLPVAASAEPSLKEKQMRKREEGYLQNAAREMNEACKTQIKAIGEWDTFKGASALEDEHTHHIGTYCGVALDAMRGICQDGDEGKQTIKAKITTMRCSFGDDVKVKDKTLMFKTRIDTERMGVEVWVRDYLLNNL